MWIHSSLPVDDLGRAVAFYQEAFGYTLMFDEELGPEIERMTGIEGMRCRLAQLRMPEDGHILELIEFRPPEGAEGSPPSAVGHGHVAFKVDDLDAEVARLRVHGAEPLGDAAGFAEGRAVYLREPAGSVVEITEIDPDSVM
jgi:predicted enzyme related to lactoylglutathione lyase